jgi:hypothetical protein
MSRMWTIFQGTGPGQFVVGCRILVTPGAGNSTYQLLPTTGIRGGLGSSSNPSFMQVQLDGETLNVFADPPPVSGIWSGGCWRFQRETEEGSWQAQATGGGPVDDDDDSEESEENKSDEDDAQ